MKSFVSVFSEYSDTIGELGDVKARLQRLRTESRNTPYTNILNALLKQIAYWEQHYKQLENKRLELLKDLQHAKDILSAEDYYILELRYIKGLTWNNIAYKIGKDEHHARRRVKALLKDTAQL